MPLRSQRLPYAGWTGLITPDLAGQCQKRLGQNDTFQLPPDSDRAQGLASTRLFWRFLSAARPQLDTAKQDHSVVSKECRSSPPQQAEASKKVSSSPVASVITADSAQQGTSAFGTLPEASSSPVVQTNGMPEAVSGDHAVQATMPQPDTSAAQEQHFQTLEQAISFFEKQDPEGFFGAPVTEAVAPNYFSVIKLPMSFQRMRQKLRALEYRTFAAFVEDFELVGNNAMRYNQKRSRVHRSAVNLLRHGKKHLNTVQLEATKAIHMLHPEGPVAAAEEEAAVNRAANPIMLAPSTSNLKQLLPSLSMPRDSSRSLQRGVSGLDMSMPMALQDLQADYFSDEDPAYSSFSDTDLEDSDTEVGSAPKLSSSHPPVVSESWGIASHPSASTLLPLDGKQSQPASSTQWQTHWLELRIHALKQQQQRYALRLQQLQTQTHQDAAPSHPPDTHLPTPAGSVLHSVPQSNTASAQHASQSAVAQVGVPHNAASNPTHISAQYDTVQASVPQQHPAQLVTQLPSQPAQQLPSQLPTTGAAATAYAASQRPSAAGPDRSQQQQEQHQASAVPRLKRRRERQQMPGLSMPELARHPFFGPLSSADPGSKPASTPQEEGRDDNYPARVHATLDLLERHLGSMKDQLTPKPPPGRAPPKKVARGGVAVARRGKAKPGRARGLFAPPAKQVIDRSDSRGKRRRTVDYDFGDVVMPPLPGAKALAQLPKVCITVPGVRQLSEEELTRRLRAVELIRSGTSISETDADLKDLVRATPGSAASADGMLESSSDEDTSDEAFAARHVALEAEEQQRFNSFAGGGAQRAARNASGSKPKPPKPPVRLDSMPPPGIKNINVAAAVIPPPPFPSVAMDPAAVLAVRTDSSAAAPAATQQAAVVSPAAAQQVQEQQPQATDGQMFDATQLQQDGALHERLMSNGQAATTAAAAASDVTADAELAKGTTALPQLGLTLSPRPANAEGAKPSYGKSATRNGRNSSTPRGSTPGGLSGRPPRGASGTITRQDSNRKDTRKLMRRNTTG